MEDILAATQGLRDPDAIQPTFVSRGRGGNHGRGGTHTTHHPVDTLDDLAAHLGVSLADLVSTPLEWLKEVVEDLRLPAAARVRIAAAHRKATKPGVDVPASPLERHFADDMLMRLHPWRVVWQQVADATAGLRKPTASQLRQSMAEMAKGGRLTMEDAWLLHILLWFPPEDHLAYAAAMLHYTGQPRTQVFNHMVATREPDAGSALDKASAFVALKGAEILQLTVPLYPRDDRFALPTMSIFSTLQPPAGGRSQNSRPDRSTFASVALGSATGFGTSGSEGEDPSGGGTLAVQQQSDGSWGVDVSVIEQAFNTCWERILRLSDEVKRLHGAPSLAEAKTIADAILMRLEEAKTGFGKAKGAALRGARGNGRGRGGGRSGFR